MRINLYKWILTFMSVFNNNMCWISYPSSYDEFFFFLSKAFHI